MRYCYRVYLLDCNAGLKTLLQQVMSKYMVIRPTDRSKAVLLLWIIYVISVLFCYAFIHVDALWLPAGKGLTSWPSFVLSNSDVVTFPLVSWDRCGA